MPLSHLKSFAGVTEGHPSSRLITSVWKVGLSVVMLILVQEPILNTLIKICIKILKNVFFFLVRVKFDHMVVLNSIRTKAFSIILDPKTIIYNWL